MANNHRSDADPLSTSVVVCTYTEMRWDSIVESVNSVLKQTVPADEVVVVVRPDEEAGWLEEGSLDEIERRLSGLRVTRLVVSDIE